MLIFGSLGLRGSLFRVRDPLHVFLRIPQKKGRQAGSALIAKKFAWEKKGDIVSLRPLGFALAFGRVGAPLGAAFTARVNACPSRRALPYASMRALQAGL
jgi:hypothetical protein